MPSGTGREVVPGSELNAGAAAGMTVRSAITAATRRFGFSSTSRLDAELLMAQALGFTREAMLLGHMDAPTPAPFAALVERRAAHEPIAYITGTRAFWTIDLTVGPGALIPRADSETLIEAAVAHFGKHAPKRVLDLGTGSGALLLAALDHWREATGLGVDASAAALEVATRNGARIAGERAVFRLGDWAGGIAEKFDLILCNPPYVEEAAALGPGVREWEPHNALFAGADGLDAYRVLAGQVPRLIAPGGIACTELGAGQFGDVAALFADIGLAIGSRHDLGGHERCLTITTPI